MNRLNQQAKKIALLGARGLTSFSAPTTLASHRVVAALQQQSIPVQQIIYRSCSTEDDAENQTLSEVLANELATEKVDQLDEKIDQEFLDIEKIISSQFKIESTTGKGTTTLAREEGDEKIVVEFDCQDEMNGDEDEIDYDAAFARENMSPSGELTDENYESEQAEVDTIGIHFTTTVTKGTSVLKFDCVATQQLTIKHVEFFPKGTGPEGENNYGGPLFNDLDPDLQDKFLEYLEARGIDTDMCYYILKYSREKEHHEYMNWLEQLCKFTH